MPDTGAYLVLGLLAMFVLLGGYITSIVVRYRNLDRDLDLIHQLREDSQ